MCSGAVCRCDKGLLPMPLTVTSNQSVTLQGKPLATTLDNVFPPFGTCLVKNNTPCVPALLRWEGYYERLTLLAPGCYPLLEQSTIKCAIGGTVSILSTLQLAVPMPPSPPQVESVRTTSMALFPLLVAEADPS